MLSLQEQIYSGALADDEEDLLEAILEQGKALPRFNSYILSPPASPDGSVAEDAAVQLAIGGAAGVSAGQGWHGLKYLHSSGSEEEVKAITHWVVADFESEVRLLKAEAGTSVARDG